MNKKYSDEPSEQKEYGSKYVMSKFDFELFDEAKYIAEPVIRVKKTNMPNKGENWKIYDNNKLIFTVDGSKINSKEKDFLRTADGFSFLVEKAKLGIPSLRNLRLEIKKILDKKTL